MKEKISNESLGELENVGLEISDCILNKEDRLFGWLCSYTPEEIIHAAGFHPVRVRGEGNPVSRADGLLHTNMCPFVRSVLDDAMSGGLDYLSGMVIANSCDAMRRLFDAWSVFRKNDTLFLLDPPKGAGDLAVLNYADQLRDFSRTLDESSPEKITDSSLARSIGIFNKTRELMAKVSILSSNGALSGYTAFNIMQVAGRCNREIFNQRLGRFLEKFTREENAGNGVRIMLAGCLIDRPDLIRVIEDVGADIVTNELCTGIRQFDQMVSLEGDPYQALAERYIRRAPCARMMDLDHRKKYLQGLTEKNRIDGVIYYIIKFCDHYMWDFPVIKKLFEEEGIPVLDVEGEYIKGSYGPLKTRIQAFVESLKG
ncbi:MAG: 2-hydroxyacyl-CoA dehydratase family protein [Thermodesulfobacteriota bacterium]|nr:2-hydroxyacyl-CoA dehydratase family protein [Thermodesulfobacteriota bacterium]